MNVPVDPSFADALPKCHACGKPVPWTNALLMPVASPCDDYDGLVGIVHRDGCGRAR